jgi:predicted phage terminase large subunit-like protein
MNNINIRDEAISQFLAQKQELDNAIRQKGLEDLFIFNKYVLGVEAGKQPLAKFHRELCRFVTDDQKKKKLMLLPRGHLKSTLVTIGYCTQQIVKNPNVRILILSATWQTAVDFVTEIKRHLTTNERLIELYGQTALNPDEWSQDRITLKRTDTNIKGPTVWAAGIESNLVGSHPDIIILDDVVNRDNTMTREQIEKVILRYRDLLDLLEPGGQFMVIGTRWVMEDLYGWILDRENNVLGSYNVMRKRAYEGNLTTGEIESFLWPEKFSEKMLKDLLREKGAYEFSAQYLNDPVPDEDATFRRDDFRYYNFEDNRGKQMQKILTVDPAISIAKDSDMTAMVATGIDSFTNIFLLEIIRAHMSPKEIIDKLFDLHELWHFNIIGIETIAFQKALAYAINEEVKVRGRYLPIVEIKSHDASKDQRIKGLQPLYQANKIYHRKELKNNIYLEDELLTFPRGRRDDVVDALSMQTQFWTPPRVKQKRLAHSYLY